MHCMKLSRFGQAKLRDATGAFKCATVPPILLTFAINGCGSLWSILDSDKGQHVVWGLVCISMAFKRLTASTLGTQSKSTSCNSGCSSEPSHGIHNRLRTRSDLHK
jgi:hypothetical protein